MTCATKTRQFFKPPKHSHVDLGKDRLFLPNLLGQLLVHRCHHPAGTASIGVKVDNDGQTGLSRMLLEQPVEFVRRPDVPNERPGRGQARKEGQQEERRADHCLVSVCEEKGARARSSSGTKQAAIRQNGLALAAEE